MTTPPPDAHPNWRDSPDELDRLCRIGAREMCGEIIRPAEIKDLTPPEEYL